MSVYVYKITAKTVRLDNGEKANVAVYSHKAGQDGSAPPGAPRHPWVVLGFRNPRTNVIELDAGAVAKRLDLRTRLISDMRFDVLEKPEARVVAATSSGIKIHSAA